MKKLIAGVVLGMTMFGGVGSLYMANTGCKSNANACQELLKKACKDADKDVKKKQICELWKSRVNGGMTPDVCEENLKKMK